MTAALARPTAKFRPSVPAPGSSLIAATEACAVHVRTAVEAVQRSFKNRDSVSAAWADVLASRWRADSHAVSETPDLQAAWGLVSMRIVGRSIGALAASASLHDAEAWFLGRMNSPRRLSDAVPELASREAVKALEAINHDDTLRDLLPYVLDAHGPGSRASVLKAPSTRKARHAKRTAGAFYTPSDIAEYITRETVGEFDQGDESPSILDPACGSGVFLKAALDLAVVRNPDLDRFDFVERSLYGIDVNPLAVEAACFVLLHECLYPDQGKQEASPWSLWHRIRCNLCAADALTFDLTPPRDNDFKALTSLRAVLYGTYMPPSDNRPDTEAAAMLFSRGIALGSVFPTLSKGVDAIIGNPPYARVGPRNDTADLEHRYVSLQGGNVAGANCYPAFLEMMWKLTRPSRNSSGMVIPLSLAYSSREQMVAIRRAIMGSGGRWRFAFFDREPHALFGEEVKIRNAIVLRYKETKGACASTMIETSPLHKWTSRQRARLFNMVEFTPLAVNSIAAGIPKLSGAQSVEIFEQLTHRTTRLYEMCVSVGSCRPEDVIFKNQDDTVFVSGTAYNFLNVFRQHRNLPSCSAPWSTSKVLALNFAAEAEAARAFAILGSRVAYWLWHVTGDGFHVTKNFVLGLPFSDQLFNENQRNVLTQLGDRLWDSVQREQIVSVNGGRKTIAYRPHSSESLRTEIDTLLLSTLDAAPSFTAYLRAFARKIVAVDEYDDRRKHMTSSLY